MDVSLEMHKQKFIVCTGNGMSLIMELSYSKIDRR